MTGNGILPIASTAAAYSADRRSTMTFRHRRIQGEVQDENAWVLNGVAGHAGLFSNVPDLLRFAGAILRSANRNPSTVRLYSLDDTIETVCRTARRPKAVRGPWAGTLRPKIFGRQAFLCQHSIGHLGYSGCSLWIDLDAAVAVVLLTNRTWPDRQSQLIREVRPSFHDAVAWRFPVNKPSDLGGSDIEVSISASSYKFWLLAGIEDTIESWGQT